MHAAKKERYQYCALLFLIVIFDCNCSWKVCTVALLQTTSSWLLFSSCGTASLSQSRPPWWARVRSSNLLFTRSASFTKRRSLFLTLETWCTNFEYTICYFYNYSRRMKCNWDLTGSSSLRILGTAQERSTSLLLSRLKSPEILSRTACSQILFHKETNGNN